MRMCRPPCLAPLATAVVALMAGHAIAADARLERLDQQFRDLPMEARRLTGPLFWLHGDESRERLEMYVGKMAEGGNGCFTAESRPHNDWLGDGWYRDLAICLESAKKNNLEMWIFDERWWPSGEVGGRVPEQFATKVLDAQSREVKGPAFETIEVPSNVVAVIAGRIADGEVIDGASLVDVGRGARPGRAVTWRVPEGRWKLMTFTWRRGDRVRGNWLVDGASDDAVAWYLQTVYQPHYDHFKRDFGKTIRGFFYDEPETPGDWGTGVIPMLRERGIDWKRALVAWKFTLGGEEQAAARYQYQDALAEAWGRTLYGGISEWCRDHDVTSIGHFLEHRNEYLSSRTCAGNMFQLMKYTDMGGIDVVFHQFRWGSRDRGGDGPIWQTPKLGSSISHVYGKRDDLTMVETFGARGQDLSYPEMKWWTDHLQVSGVNFTIPHSFNPRAPNDTDCPPYFYNGGFEPRWPLYRVYADYTSRLSLLLSGGRHIAPVALLYLGNSAHVGRFVPPEHMSEALQDALFDCDWMPYDVFEDDADLSRREIRLHQERYRVLVVPPVEVIPYGTLAKAKAFFDRGGIVIGHGFLPTKSATLGHTASDITSLREAIWGRPTEPSAVAVNTNRAGGRAYFLPERPTPADLQQVMTGDAGVHPTLEVVEGKTDNWLHVLHRQKDGHDIFFVCNQLTGGVARAFTLRVQARGEPESWDAMRNEITVPAYTRIDNGTVDLTLTLAPLESVALVFASGQRNLPSRSDSGSYAPGIPAIEVARVLRPPAAPAATSESEEPTPLIKSLEGGTWIWHPEGNPAASAPPGTRYFRKTIVLPDDRKITSARFVLTADNEFQLFINGLKSGAGGTKTDAWRTPVELDVADALRAGTNLISVTAVNTTDHPSAAGLIGRLTVRFESGAPLVVVTDATWESSERETGDRRAAKVVAKFGDAPWGRLGDSGRQGGVTRSPIAAADPFDGRFEIPVTVDLSRVRVLLETTAPTPEDAARISINGQYAGGFIGAPYRLDVTRMVKIGPNEIRIEPFAPTHVNIILQPHPGR